MAAEESTKDTFVFFSKSADAKPGKGAGEILHTHTSYNLPDNFRKILSNFHVAEFQWNGNDIFNDPFEDGTRFKSIEHAFQASKFKLAAENPKNLDARDVLNDAANQFTLNSGNAIGQGDGALAQKNRKLVRLSTVDLDRWSRSSKDVMASAARALYTQNPREMEVLKATQSATLLHKIARSPKTDHFMHLEKIRDSASPKRRDSASPKRRDSASPKRRDSDSESDVEFLEVRKRSPPDVELFEVKKRSRSGGKTKNKHQKHKKNKTVRRMKRR